MKDIFLCFNPYCSGCTAGSRVFLYSFDIQ